MPCPAPFNLAAHVLGRAAAVPEKTALRVLGPGGTRLSFRDLETAVRGTGTGLREAGLAPGDILLMRLGNSADFPIAYLGAIAAGIVPVPTSVQLTRDEVSALAADLRPAAVLAGAGIAVPDDLRVIAQSALGDMRTRPPCAYAMGDPDRLAYIVCTSGTSGRARAVAHAHRAIWARRMMFTDWYGLGEDDRLLHAGAFNWTYTLGTGLMDPWTMGATALIAGPGTGPQDLPDMLGQGRATIFAAAPGVYRKMLAGGDPPDLPHLRHGLCAGEKLSPNLQDRWQAATGKPLFEAFGMSECSTFISTGPGNPARADTLGRPQTGRRVAILGAQGPVGTGEEGEIAIHRTDPGLMLGYVNAPEETRARFRGDWFLTGDQGSMTKDGQITYLGRKDDMMNAGGFRVSPLEVEAALADFPDIRQVGVAEVRIKQDTSIIAAFYCAPRLLDQTRLADHAASRLARYKQPRAYIRLPELPVTATGKLLRRALPSHFPKASP